MSETLVGTQPIDSSKRTWLIASGCAGAVGGVATAIPFVSTFQPSERAKAAGAAVEVDIAGLKPGEKVTVEWRGKPVWVVRRTPEQLAAVKAQIESMQAEAAAKEEEVPVAEPVEDAATETVEEEKTEAAGGSEEAPEAE